MRRLIIGLGMSFLFLLACEYLDGLCVEFLYFSNTYDTASLLCINDYWFLFTFKLFKAFWTTYADNGRATENVLVSILPYVFCYNAFIFRQCSIFSLNSDIPPSAAFLFYNRFFDLSKVSGFKYESTLPGIPFIVFTFLKVIL